VEELERGILELARETDVIHIPSYSPVDRQKLLPDLIKVHSALSYLSVKDKATYVSPQDGEIVMNAEFNIIPETIDELLTRVALKSTGEMILAVKRPDYLGESQWEFRHGTHPITAKIHDDEWLKKFQARQIDVRPGDSLRAVVETVVNYGYYNEVVSTHHNVLEIKEVLPANPSQQYPLI
jgi:hypothetical protein